jgi:hypothetical protein
MNGDPHEGCSARKRSLRLRRVLRRRWIFGLLPLLALGASLVWMAPVIVANTALMHRIISAALSDFEGRITVGSASLGWLSPVVVHDVAAMDPAGLPLTRIQSIRSERSLFGLLIHQRQPGGFHLDQPTIHLVLRADGSNWEDALAKYLDQPAGDSSLEKIRLKITGGTIEIQDPTAGTWKLDDLDMDFQMSQREEPWLQVRLESQVQAAGTPPGQISAELQWRAATGPKQTIGPGRVVWQVTDLPLTPCNALLQRLGLNMQLDGLASARGEYRWDAGLINPYLTLKNLDGQQLTLRAADWLGDETLTCNSLNLRGQIAQTAEGWRLDNVALLCDFARLEARGALPHRSDADLDWLNLIRDVQREDVQIAGQLDVAALTTMLPKTLRIRPTTRITSGNVKFSLASQRGDEPSFSASLQASDLAAVENGRPFAWKEPVLATANFRYTADGPVIDQLVCHAEFLDVVASGRWNSGTAKIQGDLNRMAAELGRFVDLGEFRMAGRIDGQLQWNQAAAERLNATGRIELHEFELAAAQSLPWREQRLVIDVAGEAELDEGQIHRIPKATFDLRSARDQLTVRLAQPVQTPWQQAAWPLELQVSGLLETWLPRLQPLVSLQGWQATGAIDLTAAATVAPEQVSLDPVKLALRELRAQNSQLGVFVDENSVRLETAGTWEFAANRLKAADTTLTSSTVALRAQQIELQLPGDRPVVRGTIGYRTDLGRLARCFQTPGQPVTSRLAGSATGTVQASYDDQKTHLDWTTDVVDFAYATLPSHSAGTPVRTVSLPDSWQEVWREASVRLAGRQRYDHAHDRLHVDRLSVATAAMKLDVQGQIAALTTQAEADLNGTLDYDLAEVTPQRPVDAGGTDPLCRAPARAVPDRRSAVRRAPPNRHRLRSAGQSRHRVGNRSHRPPGAGRLERQRAGWLADRRTVRVAPGAGRTARLAAAQRAATGTAGCARQPRTHRRRAAPGPEQPAGPVDAGPGPAARERPDLARDVPDVAQVRRPAAGRCHAGRGHVLAGAGPCRRAPAGFGTDRGQRRADDPRRSSRSGTAGSRISRHGAAGAYDDRRWRVVQRPSCVDLVGAPRPAGAFRNPARPGASSGPDRDGRRHGVALQRLGRPRSDAGPGRRSADPRPLDHQQTVAARPEGHHPASADPGLVHPAQDRPPRPGRSEPTNDAPRSQRSPGTGDRSRHPTTVRPTPAISRPPPVLHRWRPGLATTAAPHRSCTGGGQVWQLPPPPTGPAPVEARFGNYRRPPPVPHRWRPGLATTAAPPPVPHRWRPGLAIPPPPTGPAPVEARFGNYRRRPPPVPHRWRPGLATTAAPHRSRTGGGQVWQLPPPPTGPAPVEARFGNYREQLLRTSSPAPGLLGSRRYKTGGGAREKREVAAFGTERSASRCDRSYLTP